MLFMDICDPSSIIVIEFKTQFSRLFSYDAHPFALGPPLGCSSIGRRMQWC